MEGIHPLDISVDDEKSENVDISDQSSAEILCIKIRDWEDKYQTCDLIAYQLDVKSLMTGVLNRHIENLAFVL